MTFDPDLAQETKALVVLAFRNGPIENLHTGRLCPVCCGMADVSHISNDEMEAVMKAAVDTLYRLLWQREHDPSAYNKALAFGRAIPCIGTIQTSGNRQGGSRIT